MKQQKKVIILCEGEVSEPTYFEGIRVKGRVQAQRIVIYRGSGVPKSVVDLAVLKKKENDRRNILDDNKVQDEVWAVFDKDDHPLIREAMQQALANQVEVGFTNPCFELFLLLHFEWLSRDEGREKVARLLRSHIAGYDKSFSYEGLDLHRLYGQAKHRIQTINDRSGIEQGIRRAPYCGLCKLVDLLRSL